MSKVLLNSELAVALGLPKFTQKAVLTLEVGKVPTIDLTMLVTNDEGLFEVVPAVKPDGTLTSRLATVRFMIRLEPFPD